MTRPLLLYPMTLTIGFTDVKRESEIIDSSVTLSQMPDGSTLLQVSGGGQVVMSAGHTLALQRALATWLQDPTP